jgi:hypothetical protein
MDRTAAAQEARELPPVNQTILLAQREAERVILQHLSLCPFATLHIEERLRTIEGRFLLLIGFMIGSGLLGGIAGGALVKALTP